MSSYSIQDIASQLFWCVATLNVVFSFHFNLRARNVTPPELPERLFTLARGQRKDDWLTCVVIWFVLLSKGCPIRQALFLVGAMVLAWLTQRTLHRVRLLQTGV
jgi:cobalamin synthase